MLAALGASEPVEVDGRVLNRNTQALLELARRFHGCDSDAESRSIRWSCAPSSPAMARLAMPVRTDVHVTGRVIRTPGGSTGIPVRIYRQFGTGIGEDAVLRPSSTSTAAGG